MELLAMVTTYVASFFPTFSFNPVAPLKLFLYFKFLCWDILYVVLFLNLIQPGISWYDSYPHFTYEETKP
jgi:hypothetical protein